MCVCCVEDRVPMLTPLTLVLSQVSESITSLCYDGEVGAYSRVVFQFRVALMFLWIFLLVVRLRLPLLFRLLPHLLLLLRLATTREATSPSKPLY